jgi:hypothetical protein
MARASAQKERRIDKYGPMLLTGIATMDADMTRRLSALPVLSCSGRAQMLSWYRPNTLG